MDVCRGDPPDTGESGRHWRGSAETLFRWTSRASLKCHRGPRCDAIGAARVVVSDWPAHGVRVVRCSSVGRGDLQAAAASYPRRPSGVRTPSTALPSPGGQGGTGRGGMAETVRPSKPLDVSGASRDAWLIKVGHAKHNQSKRRICADVATDSPVVPPRRSLISWGRSSRPSASGQRRVTAHRWGEQPGCLVMRLATLSWTCRSKTGPLSCAG